METTALIPTPVATSEQYIKAILKIRDKKMLPESHIEMLKAQYRAPNSTITATQLADAVNFPNYNSANLQYGTLACNIADALGYTRCLCLHLDYY